MIKDGKREVETEVEIRRNGNEGQLRGVEA